LETSIKSAVLSSQSTAVLVSGGCIFPAFGFEVVIYVRGYGLLCGQSYRPPVVSQWPLPAQSRQDCSARQAKIVYCVTWKKGKSFFGLSLR
jgi:hypothetical protein